MITQEQEIAWRENIVTKKLFSELERLKQLYLDRIGNSTRAYNSESFAVHLARDAGIIEAINVITTAELYDPPQEIKNEQEVQHNY
jgi:hypothetical protein